MHLNHDETSVTTIFFVNFKQKRKVALIVKWLNSWQLKTTYIFIRIILMHFKAMFAILQYHPPPHPPPHLLFSCENWTTANSTVAIYLGILAATISFITCVDLLRFYRWTLMFDRIDFTFINSYWVLYVLYAEVIEL